ncbi:Protein NDUFAF4 homolog [Anthophora plagiata]
MGKVYSFFTRPVRTFNIENRAERVITREKPIRAPEYASVQKQKEEVNKLYPDFIETHNKENSQLHDNLKNIFVVSEDPQETPVSKNPSAAKGECTYDEITEFLTLYQENCKEFSVEKISQDYNLDKQTVENIISYFRILRKTTVEELSGTLNKEK